MCIFILKKKKKGIRKKWNNTFFWTFEFWVEAWSKPSEVAFPIPCFLFFSLPKPLLPWEKSMSLNTSVGHSVGFIPISYSHLKVWNLKAVFCAHPTGNGERKAFPKYGWECDTLSSRAAHLLTISGDGWSLGAYLLGTYSACVGGQSTLSWSQYFFS